MEGGQSRVALGGKEDLMGLMGLKALKSFRVFNSMQLIHLLGFCADKQTDPIVRPSSGVCN